MTISINMSPQNKATENASYVRELRKIVGSRPLLLPGVSVFIQDQRGYFLFLLRSDNHCWSPPGGMIEPGENPEDTALREVQEETGLTLTDLKLVSVIGGKEMFYTYPNGDQVYNLNVLFEARADSSNPLHLDHENRESGWFPLNKIPEPLSPPAVHLLKRYIQVRESNLQDI